MSVTVGLCLHACACLGCCWDRLCECDVYLQVLGYDCMQMVSAGIFGFVLGWKCVEDVSLCVCRCVACMVF